MRPTLTWEEHAGSRSLAAVYERGALVLALVLPVPMLAAAGLSLPLPQSIFRLGILAAERTALIADALPGVARDRPAREAAPVVHRAVHVARPTAQRATPVAAPSTVAPRHRPAAAHRSHRQAAATSTEVVTKPKPAAAPKFAGRGQTDPTTDPVTTTPTPTTSTPSTPAQPATPTSGDTGATAVVTPPATSGSETTKTDRPAKSPKDEQPVQDSGPAPTATPPVTTTPVTTTPVTTTPAKTKNDGHADPPATTPPPAAQSGKGSGDKSTGSGGSSDKKNATTTVSATG